MSNGSHRPNIIGWLLWIGIAGAILIYGLVPIGIREINLSLFDVALPIAAFLALLLGRRPMAGALGEIASWRESRLAVLALALIATHLAVVAFGFIEVSVSGFAREFAKSAGFFGQFLLLVVLFRNLPTPLASPGFFLGLIIAVAAIAIVRHFAELYLPGSWFLPRNLHLALLATLLFAQYLSAYQQRSNAGGPGEYHPALIGSHVICAITAFVLLNKAYVAVFILMAPILWVRSGRGTIIVAGLLVVAGIGALIGLPALTEFSAFKSFDSITFSAGIRGALWVAAIEAGNEAFPWGLGLGQLAAILQALPESTASEPIRFAHNVFVAHYAEMGVLGLLTIGALIGLILSVCCRLPHRLALVATLLLLVPMMLQDALGLRALPVLLAAALVASSSNTES